MGDDVGGLGQHFLIDVTERHNLDRRDLNQTDQVALAVPAAADQPDSLGLFFDAERETRRSGEREGRCGRTGLEEIASIHGLIPLVARTARARDVD